MDLNINLFNINHHQAKAEKGTCLISEPFSADSYFGRSVVLLTEHDQENGSVGYIMNKPVDIQIQDLFPEFPEFAARCYVGGPVSPDTIHYLHSRPDVLPASNHVFGNIYWGGDFDRLQEQVEQGNILSRDIKFFLGYSGWAPEQLKQEMDEKFWILAKISDRKLMGKSKDIWKNTLSNMGESYKLWAEAPMNPALN
jgi:putative transcriptional regulator